MSHTPPRGFKAGCAGPVSEGKVRPMHLAALQPLPPASVFALLDQRDWPRLAQCLDDGFPANAAWPGKGSLFERFVIAASVPTRPPAGSQEHALQVATLEAFLRAGLKPEVPFGDERSLSLPLSIAALMGRTDMVERLLEAGHPASGPGPGRQSPLGVLASRKMGDPGSAALLPFALVRPCVALLLRAGADPNRPAEDGWLPLQLAASCGDRELCHALVEAGANPNGKAPGPATEPGPRFTPLAWAIQRNDGTLVDLFLRHRGNLLARIDTAQVSLAEFAGRVAGPDVWRAIVDELGWDHEEVRRGWFQAVAADSHVVVQWFLAAGFDPRPANQWGWTPLALALREQAWICAHRLARCGFDPHAPDPEGQTPYARVKAWRGNAGLSDLGWSPKLVAFAPRPREA